MYYKYIFSRGQQEEVESSFCIDNQDLSQNAFLGFF